MRRFLDLHTHSTASDGSLTPAELIARADAARLLAVALTDHDTTAGVAEAAQAAAAFPELRFIPGIEVSAEFAPGVLHILGLGIDPDSPALARLAADLRAARDQRNPKIIAKLQGLGLAINMDDVAAQAAKCPPEDRIIGRAHIAMAMVAKGCVRTVEEAFDRYIDKGGPAYVEKDKLAARAVIDALHAAGPAGRPALVALAHPPQLQCDDDEQLGRVIGYLADAGLDAIECYHSDHTSKQTRVLLNLAAELHLGVVGGSDFHGALKPTVQVGRPKVSLTMIAGIAAARLLG